MKPRGTDLYIWPFSNLDNSVINVESFLPQMLYDTIIELSPYFYKT